MEVIRVASFWRHLNILFLSLLMLGQIIGRLFYSNPTPFSTISINMLHYIPLLLFRPAIILFATASFIFYSLCFLISQRKSFYAMGMCASILLTLTAATLNSLESDSVGIYPEHDFFAISYFVLGLVTQFCFAYNQQVSQFKRWESLVLLMVSLITVTINGQLGVVRKMLLASLIEHAIVFYLFWAGIRRAEADDLTLRLNQGYQQLRNK